MIEPLDEIPEYIEQEVRGRIGASGSGSTLVVDDDKGEFIVGYTGFTDALSREYKQACDNRNEDAIKVYQISTDGTKVKVTRYQSAKGREVEQIWRE